MIVEAWMQLMRLQNNENTCERETVSPPIYPVDRQKNQSHLYDIRIEQFSMRWCVPDVDLHLHHQWRNTKNLLAHMISIDEKPSVERNPGRPKPWRNVAEEARPKIQRIERQKQRNSNKDFWKDTDGSSSELPAQVPLNEKRRNMAQSCWCCNKELCDFQEERGRKISRQA